MLNLKTNIYKGIKNTALCDLRPEHLITRERFILLQGEKLICARLPASFFTDSLAGSQFVNIKQKYCLII